MQQTLQQVKGGLKFGQQKTQKSRRVIALPPLTCEALRRHKTEQARARLLLGRAYNDHDLVCCRMHGTPISPNELTAAFAKLIRSLPLPRIRFHDLRHTYATQLLQQNIHPKVVSERLGHSTIAITLDTYSHVIPGMQEEAARRIDEALRAAIQHVRQTPSS